MMLLLLLLLLPPCNQLCPLLFGPHATSTEPHATVPDPKGLQLLACTLAAWHPLHSATATSIAAATPTQLLSLQPPCVLLPCWPPSPHQMARLSHLPRPNCQLSSFATATPGLAWPCREQQQHLQQWLLVLHSC